MSQVLGPFVLWKLKGLQAHSTRDVITSILIEKNERKENVGRDLELLHFLFPKI